MTQTVATAAGQVSADGQFRWDGQQWVPIPKGEREPTAWTRPMQLAAAALFAIDAVASVAFSLIFETHSAMVQVLKQQNSQLPPGMTIDQLADTARAVAIGVVVFIAVLALVAAVGSFLGWRWMFWAALVLFAFGGIGALTNIAALTNPSSSAYPVWVLVVNELISIASAAMFVWMLIAAIKYGPWAMKKPGAPS